MSQAKYSIDLNNTVNVGFADRNNTLYGAIKTGTPGPGTYKIISEFGKYDLRSPGLLETDANTPIKRAFSAMSNKKKRP